MQTRKPATATIWTWQLRLGHCRHQATVDKFLDGTTDTDELLSGIQLVSRAQTTVATGTHTPRKGLIVLKKKIVSVSADVTTLSAHPNAYVSFSHELNSNLPRVNVRKSPFLRSDDLPSTMTLNSGPYLIHLKEGMSYPALVAPSKSSMSRKKTKSRFDNFAIDSSN